MNKQQVLLQQVHKGYSSLTVKFEGFHHQLKSIEDGNLDVLSDIGNRCGHIPYAIK